MMMCAHLRSTGVMVVHGNAQLRARIRHRTAAIRPRTHRLERSWMACAGVALFGRSRKPCHSTSKPLHRQCPARFKLVIYGNGFRPRDALDDTIATIDSDRIRFGRRQISGAEEFFYLHHSPCRLPYPLSGLKPSVHFYPLGNGITVIRIAIRALEIFRIFLLPSVATVGCKPENHQSALHCLDDERMREFW